MNQTALIDYISHHTSNVPLTPKPNHKYIIKSPTHSIQQQHPQQQQLTKEQDQDHDQDQDHHSNFSISTKDPSNLISNSSTSPIRPRPTPKPRSKEPLPSSSQFLLSQHQSNLSSNLTSLNHHQHHHQFKSQESQESQASQLDSNYHLPDLPSAISSFNVNIFSNNSSSNFNQNQSSSNHILNHHQTYSPILQSHSSNLQKDLFEKNSINSDLNQTSSISKPFHQSSNSSLQTSSTPFNKDSSIINNPPLNPINSNLTPPQSIHSTPQSPSKFKSNHSISNSDSMLNLTNIHLHQSAPTIYPASLLHPPHLNDLLTIHPSKLNLKGKHKSIEPLLSSLPLTDLKSSSKPSQSSQLTDLENSNIHQTLHKHSDLQQSPKHLHQYLDSNISPLSTYQTPQSSFHPPLESDNHFITRSKRSNSSNSVPSNSQKSFQTDSQTTQSPFQNRSGSIASTSRSRTPSVLKLIKTGFRSKTPSFSSSLAHCDQSSARLSSSSFYSSPANKAQAVKSSSSSSSSLSSSHLNQDVRAHDLQIKTQNSKPSEIDHHNPLVANQFKSSWILQRSQSDSANHLPHYKASLAKRFLIRPQTSISIASIPKPTPKKLEVQTELTKDHDCQNLHLQIKPVVRNLHQSDQIEKAQENNNNVALVSNKEKVNQHERKTSVDKKAKEKVLLERLNDQESPEEYLERLSLVVGQSRIPSVLATSSNEYYQSVLLQFMTLFEFGHDPIDLALRKFLMIVYLPKETQEIDRVIENFSKRYLDCNPKLFNSHDQVYLLAFSIIMLHTDWFNKSNKSKMTRSDYVKNTKMDGIPNEILEYIYDNVTYSQFIFVDHDKAVASQKLENSNGFGISLGTNSNGKDKAKLDPYQLISQGLTHELRPDIESVIPSRNPYSFTGSIHSLDFNRLRNSFGFDSVAIQVINPISTKSNSAIKQLVSEIILINKTSNGELTAAGDSNARLESGGDDQSLRSVNDLRMTWEPENNRNEEGALCLKAVKVGLVYRKDEGDGLIKNVTKKWKASCTLLTAGQLIFMKDLRLVKELQESLHQASIRNQQNPSDRSVVRITGLKPDSVFSLEDAIALMDSTYKRRPFTFRLILSKEHNFLMGVENEADMNSWITHINYAAAYKTNRLSFRHQFFFGGDGSQTKTSMSNSTNMSHIKSLTDGQQIISEKLNSGGSYTPFQESSLFDTESSRFQSSSERSSQRINAKNQFRVSGSTGGRTNSPPNSRRHSRDDQTSLASNINLENAKKKLLKLDSQILTAKNDLNEDLRLARNLAVLTPFQLSTRARLQQAIIPVADRIRTSRYALSKLLCYREILIRDFPLKPIRSRQNTLNQQVGLEKSPSNDENNKAGLASRTEAVEEKKLKIEVSDLREPLIEASNINETVPRLDKNMINLQEAALPIELKEKLEETPGNPLKGKLEKYQVERKEGSQINKKTSVKADDGCQVLENQSKECRGYYTELANYRRSSSASKTSKAELLSEPIVERFGFKLRGRRLSGPVLMTEIGAELKQRRESPRRNSITDLMEGSSKFLSNLGLNSTKHPEGVQRSTSGFMKAIKQHSLTDFKMTNYNPECEADLSDEKRAKGDKKGSMMGSLTGCSIGYSRGLGLGESDLRATPTEGWHEGGGREENLINNNGGLKGLRFPKVLRRPTTSVASNSTHQQSIGSPNSSGNTLSKKTFKAIGAKSSTSQSNQSDSSNIIKSLNHSKRTSPITPISPSFTSNSTQQPYHSNGNPSIQNKRFTQAWGLP